MLPAGHPTEDAPQQNNRPRLVGERDADEDQEDEVDRPDRGGVQVAQLLADLPLDLEPGHRGPHQPELEERAERRRVRTDAGLDAGVLRALPADEDGLRAADDRRGTLE